MLSDNIWFNFLISHGPWLTVQENLLEVDTLFTNDSFLRLLQFISFFILTFDLFLVLNIHIQIIHMQNSRRQHQFKNRFLDAGWILKIMKVNGIRNVTWLSIRNDIARSKLTVQNDIKLTVYTNKMIFISKNELCNVDWVEVLRLLNRYKMQRKVIKHML